MICLIGVNLSSDNSETRNLFGWTLIALKQSVLGSAAAVKFIQDKA